MHASINKIETSTHLFKYPFSNIRILKIDLDSERAEYARNNSPNTSVKKHALLATSRESCT